ncbi:MAG: RAMP superfamily CRISPR-associated protein [Clostridium sp.]|uniref:RAMP superfamily CRISPR-associated protein n=1 Tax=Clostridium sp. TaxID=1506 RepID=UPI003F3BDB6C
MGLKGNKIVSFFRIDLESIGPFKIADDEEILVDDNNNSYVPGSSVGGALRNFTEEEYGENIATLLFGKEKESKIIVFDSVIENSKIVYRPGIRIGEDGLVEEGAYFIRDYVEDGAKLKINLKVFSENEEENEEFKKIIGKIVRGIDKEIIRFGMNKTNGAGIFKVEKAEILELNLEKKEDLIKYINLDKEKDEFEKFKYKKEIEVNKNYIFTFKGRCKTPILISAIGELDFNKADKMNIRNSKMPIIPGSSIKGAIKNKFEKIAKMLNEEKLILEAFGGMDKKNNKSGRIFFSDIELEGANVEKIQTRIKIDRLTGGARNSALIEEIPVKGEVAFKIIYKKTGEEKKDKKIVEILLYTIKDLAEGKIQLGSGKSIGRGYLEGDTIKIETGNLKATMDIKNKNIENKDELKEMISIKG